MNTQDTSQDSQDRHDTADEALRALLAGADPEAGVPAPVDPQLLDRVLADVAEPQDRSTAAAGGPTRPAFLRRHWQGTLLVAASVATLALAIPPVFGGLGAFGSESDSAAMEVSAADGNMDLTLDDTAARNGAEAGLPAPAPDQFADIEAGAAGAAESPSKTADTAEQTLVRSGSVLVGTDDVTAGRDSFVAAVLGMGGRIMSETVTSEGSASGGGATPYDSDSMSSGRSASIGYPYPWYPQGPGIWLSVEVPAASYDKAIEAARATGEVVALQQSAYDVGAQITDVDARIKALDSSLSRLTALMDDAKGITDVITLESAIAARQSELDSLRAQQRELANQTTMSGISLTLMSPQDARGTVDTNPEQSWWESFAEGLAQFWSWLGHALVIVSPLLLAGTIIWWVRRRRDRRARRAGAAVPSVQEPSA